MKKYILIFLTSLSVFSYAIKDLSSMQSLKFNTIEKQLLNGKEKTLRYSVSIEFPDKIRKEIIFPELNKGEVYIYNGDKKNIYLPIFDEYRESEIDGDENKIIQTINKLRILEKNPETKKEYQSKKLKALYIDDSQTILVNIKEYIEKDDYILPKSIEIKEGSITLGTVLIEDIEINPKLDEKIFLIEQDKK